MAPLVPKTSGGGAFATLTGARSLHDASNEVLGKRLGRQFGDHGAGLNGGACHTPKNGTRLVLDERFCTGGVKVFHGGNTVLAHAAQ